MTDRKRAVIVDLDGTLASNEWRSHHVTAERSADRDWPAFFKAMDRDAVVEPVRDLTWAMHESDYQVLLVTGRPANYLDLMLDWLQRHAVPWDELLTRDEGDYRPDTEVKRELYKRYIEPEYEVVFAVDDNPKVIEVWRDLGLYVLTVEDPDLEPLDG